MGWKGAVRSFGAAVRASERESRRHQRELDKQQKQYEKMQALEQAAYEVEVYENSIEVIQSVHKECSDRIDWENIATSQMPKKPEKLMAHEKSARTKAEKYKPGIIDRAFKREEKQRIRHEKNITSAIEEDEAEYRENWANWEKELCDWKEGVELAQLLLKGDEKAKITTINELSPFSEISTIGSNISVSVGDGGIVEAIIHIHGDDVVPDEVKSLLQSGKISVKKMPKGKFNEIYQDYVCSCVLRVANELFSAIPDNMVIVTAVDELLSTKSGHLEKSPILSVCVSRSTLDSLNMDNIDPSDSMSNFVYNMSFKKNKGFESVELVSPP